MKKQNFIKGSLILIVSAAVSKLLGAVFKIPLTNLLGGIGMSYFSCAYSLFMPVYALTVTGLSAAVAKMTAQSMALGMYENARRVRKTALMLFSAVGAVGSLAVIVLARPFCLYAAGIEAAETAVIMISPSVFFGCITAVERGYYEGMSNMYPTAVSQLAEGIVKAVTGLYLCGYVTENGDAIIKYFPHCDDVRALAAAAGILGVTLSSVGAAIVLKIFRLFHKKNRLSGSPHLMSRGEIAHELTAIALPSGAGALVTNLTALIDMGTVIGCIALYSGTVRVPEGVSSAEMPHFVYGSYAGIALTVFNLIPSMTNMLGKGILPSVTEAWSGGDRKTLERGTMQALVIAALISVPAAVGMGVLSEEILTFLFPKQTDEVALCVNSLRLLMPGMVCLCISYPIFSMLQAIGKPSAPLKIMLFGAVVKLVGNIILIPLMGADGAALSTTLCYLLILAAALRVYCSAAKLRPMVSPFAVVLYSGIMCGAVAYLAKSVFLDESAPPITRILVAGAVGGTVYIASIAILRKNVTEYRCKSYTPRCCKIFGNNCSSTEYMK